MDDISAALIWDLRDYVHTGKSLCALSFAPALSPATCKPRARYGPITGMLYAKPAIVCTSPLAKTKPNQPHPTSQTGCCMYIYNSP